MSYIPYSNYNVNPTRNHVNGSLTNQVPYLVANPQYPQERFFFLPFLGGLALGGLLFNNRPCCGGYGYGNYPYPYPAPYPYPYPYQQNYYQPAPYQQQQQQQSMQNAYYGPYSPTLPNQHESTVVESNKYYIY